MEKTTSTEVLIMTESYRIDGRIALYPGARLTDFIRSAPEFIAVTGVTVSSKSGEKSFECAFLDVGTHFIELIVPKESIKAS